VVFGHFGHLGGFNSLGDNDFTLNLSDFSHSMYLGHIHTNSVRGNKIVLGTQYTTNFGESGQQKYYGVFEDDKFTLKKWRGGPRYIALDYDYLDEIDINRYDYVLLRLFISATQDETFQRDVAELRAKHSNIRFVDIKYKSLLDTGGAISSFEPEKDIFEIDDDLIRQYVEEQCVDIPMDSLMEGYRKLKEEANAQIR